MNQLNVSLQQSILTLTAKGWSARKISRELGIDRETVGRYRQQTVSKPANVPTGSGEGVEAKPAIMPAGSKAGRPSQCLPLAGVIEPAVQAGLSASTFSRIWWASTASAEGMIRSEVRAGSIAALPKRLAAPQVFEIFPFTSPIPRCDVVPS